VFDLIVRSFKKMKLARPRQRLWHRYVAICLRQRSAHTLDPIRISERLPSVIPDLAQRSLFGEIPTNATSS
jgi:hypothetical protein